MAPSVPTKGVAEVAWGYRCGLEKCSTNPKAGVEHSTHSEVQRAFGHRHLWWVECLHWYYLLIFKLYCEGSDFLDSFCLSEFFAWLVSPHDDDSRLKTRQRLSNLSRRMFGLPE